MTGLHRAVLMLALLGALPAAAAPTVIYRCVAADGGVTLQNGSRCPKGSREQKRTIAAPTAPAAAPRPALAASPKPVPSVPIPAPASPGTAATATDTPVPRLPPPMLYACLTSDAQRYYSDASESSRCAPLEAVGLDGRSASPAEACEVRQDRCEPVPEAERCGAWAERRRVAEQALTFAPEQLDAAHAEIERVDAAVAGTACGR